MMTLFMPALRDLPETVMPAASYTGRPDREKSPARRPTKPGGTLPVPWQQEYRPSHQFRLV
jgi:hypothetical protein